MVTVTGIPFLVTVMTSVFFVMFDVDTIIPGYPRAGSIKASPMKKTSRDIMKQTAVLLMTITRTLLSSS